MAFFLHYLGMSGLFYRFQTRYDDIELSIYYNTFFESLKKSNESIFQQVMTKALLICSAGIEILKDGQTLFFLYDNYKGYKKELLFSKYPSTQIQNLKHNTLRSTVKLVNIAER